jgi:predicted transcriptional regulator
MPCQAELTQFDRKLLNYIYKYPGQTVLTVQNDFRSKSMVSNSLRYLARRGLITIINFRIYPVCSQVIA